VAERVPEYPELQVGVHVVPEAASATQSPAPEFKIFGREVQIVETQDPVLVHVVSAQVAERIPENPELHMGVHVEPEEAPTAQSPAPALAIEGRELQALEVQDPETLQAVFVHVAETVPENPELQEGAHVVPEAELITQSPGPAFTMAGRVAQAVLVQDPVVAHEPDEHVAERVPEYPELHVGVHVTPDAIFVTQFPISELGIAGRVAQG
jgi:hypothetical protein